jgi:hypothetical protein
MRIRPAQLLRPAVAFCSTTHMACTGLQGFPYNTFGQQGSNRARSVQSFPPHQLAPQFVQQQRAAAQKGPDAAQQYQSLHVHSAPNGGAASNAPTKTANGATSRAPPKPQNNKTGATGASVGPQAMRTMQLQHQQGSQQQQAPQQRPGQHKPSAEQEAADRSPAAAPEDAAAAGKERRAQVRPSLLHWYSSLQCLGAGMRLPFLKGPSTASRETSGLLRRRCTSTSRSARTSTSPRRSATRAASSWRRRGPA